MCSCNTTVAVYGDWILCMKGEGERRYIFMGVGGGGGGVEKKMLQ